MYNIISRAMGNDYLKPTFSNATVQQYSPWKPHSTGQIKSRLFFLFPSQFKPAKRAKPV